MLHVKEKDMCKTDIYYARLAQTTINTYISLNSVRVSHLLRAVTSVIKSLLAQNKLGQLPL
jgi:hypothetical protein